MSIGNEGIDILIDAARVEIASARQPFSKNIAAIELYFDMLEKEVGSPFELIEAKGLSPDNPDNAVYVSMLGVFDFTPRIGKLLIPNGDSTLIGIPFFNAADKTASLLSAAVRFTERRMDYVERGNAGLIGDRRERKIFLAGDDIGTLIQAAGVEIASATQPFSEHIDDVEQYFSLAASLPNSQFKVFSTVERTDNHAVYETNLGTFDFTPEEARLLTKEGGMETSIPFFSGKDPTLSLISAAVRFVERRSVFVKQYIRAEM